MGWSNRLLRLVVLVAALYTITRGVQTLLGERSLSLVDQAVSFGMIVCLAGVLLIDRLGRSQSITCPDH